MAEYHNSDTASWDAGQVRRERPAVETEDEAFFFRVVRGPSSSGERPW